MDGLKGDFQIYVHFYRMRLIKRNKYGRLEMSKVEKSNAYDQFIKIIDHAAVDNVSV